MHPQRPAAPDTSRSTGMIPAGPTTQNSPRSSAKPQSDHGSPQSAPDPVSRLFAALQGIFPAWRQAFATDAEAAEARRQWSAGLIDAGITDSATIRVGLARARRSKSPFLPSVGQFVEWCREAARDRIGFPTVESVLAQITQYSHASKFPPRNPDHWPQIHPVAYWIYQHVDKYAVAHARQDEARRLVGIVYDEAVERAARGMEFPLPPKLIPDEIGAGAPSTPEQIAAASAARASIRSMFGGGR